MRSTRIAQIGYQVGKEIGANIIGTVASVAFNTSVTDLVSTVPAVGKALVDGLQTANFYTWGIMGNMTAGAASRWGSVLTTSADQLKLGAQIAVKGVSFAAAAATTAAVDYALEQFNAYPEDPMQREAAKRTLASAGTNLLARGFEEGITQAVVTAVAFKARRDMAARSGSLFASAASAPAKLDADMKEPLLHVVVKP